MAYLFYVQGAMRWGSFDTIGLGVYVLVVADGSINVRSTSWDWR